MIEDIPDHQMILDETDDPHGPLKFLGKMTPGFGIIG
jgi:hypothetical protein